LNRVISVYLEQSSGLLEEPREAEQTADIEAVKKITNTFLKIHPTTNSAFRNIKLSVSNALKTAIMRELSKPALSWHGYCLYITSASKLSFTYNLLPGERQARNEESLISERILESINATTQTITNYKKPFLYVEYWQEQECRVP